MNKTGHPQNESAARAGQDSGSTALPVSPLRPRTALRALRRKPQPSFDCRYAAGFGGCDSSAFESGAKSAD